MKQKIIKFNSKQRRFSLILAHFLYELIKLYAYISASNQLICLENYSSALSWFCHEKGYKIFCFKCLRGQHKAALGDPSLEYFQLRKRH